MKMVKRLFTVLMSLMMVLVLAVPAFAEGNGTITINNATVGNTYAIYKVFDATYSGNLVAYTYTKTGDTDALYTALTAEDSPFTLSETVTTGVYNVSLKDGTADTAVATWLQNNQGKLTETNHMDATSETVRFENLAPGYYYVTSTLGAVVTITSAAPDVIIQDKNQTPGPDPDDSKYKVIVDKDGAPITGESTVNYGDTVYYVLKAKATNYDGDKQIVSYTAHDVLGAGLTGLTVTKVEIINSDDASNVITLTGNNGYTVNTSANDGCTAEITINWTSGTGTELDPYVSLYNANSMIKVYCQATVTDTATVGTEDPDITNKGWFTWLKDDQTSDDGDNEPTTVTSYTYAIGVYKTDKKGNPLANATFTIADPNHNPVTVTKESDGVYKYDPDGTTTEVVSNSQGRIIVKGLAASGTYTLTETAAPAGYNKLSDTISVEATKMTASTTTTTIYKDDKGEIVEQAASTTSETIRFDVPVAAVNVVNEAGTQLPSTGGMGTTVFYLIGGVLVVAAGILMVTKRRMKDDK